MFSQDCLYIKQYRGQGFMTICKFNKEGNFLFVADKDSKYITKISTINNQIIGTYNGHNGVIWHIDITPDNKYMCSCSGDMSCILWNVENGDIINKIDETGIPKYVSIKDDLVIITCEPISKRSKSYVSIYSLTKLINGDNTQLYKYIETENKLTTANLINESVILITNDNGLVKKINYKTNEIIQEQRIHTETIKSISLTNNNTFLTGSTDKTAKIINMEDLTEIAVFNSTVPINTAIFTPDNNYVLLGGGIEAMMVAKTHDNDLTTKVFQISNQKLIKQITNHFGPLRFLDFNNNNKCFVSASQDGTVKIHYFEKPKNEEPEIKLELFGFALHKNIDELYLKDEIITFDTKKNINTKISQTSQTSQKKKDKETETYYPIGHSFHKEKDKATNYVISTNNNLKSHISTVRVCNLPEDVDPKDLWDMFEYYGRIENNGIKIKKIYNDTIAFVHYLNDESAKKAIEKCNKKKLGYNIINVDMAKNN
jgi:translation initiation factor 3 subunit I